MILQMIINSCIEYIDNTIIPNCSAFKIGKTGQLPQDRFSAEEYKSRNHQVLQSSKSKTRISILEALLIAHYQNHPKCRNERGALASFHDDMTSTTGEYHLYIVWN